MRKLLLCLVALAASAALAWGQPGSPDLSYGWPHSGGGGGGTPTYVNGAISASSYTVTYTPTAGNLVFVTAGNGNNGTGTPTISDSTAGANTWTACNGSPLQDGVHGNTFGAWWTIVSTPFTSVTISGFGGTSFAATGLAEYSGIAAASPADGGATNGPTTIPGTATDGIVGASVTTTANGDLVLNAVYYGGASTTLTWNAGTGYTRRNSSSSDPSAASHLDFAIEDKNQTTAGAIAPTWTATQTGTFYTFTCAFKHS